MNSFGPLITTGPGDDIFEVVSDSFRYGGINWYSGTGNWGSNFWSIDYAFQLDSATNILILGNCSESFGFEFYQYQGYKFEWIATFPGGYFYHHLDEYPARVINTNIPQQPDGSYRIAYISPVSGHIHVDCTVISAGDNTGYPGFISLGFEISANLLDDTVVPCDCCCCFEN